MRRARRIEVVERVTKEMVLSAKLCSPTWRVIHSLHICGREYGTDALVDGTRRGPKAAHLKAVREASAEAFQRLMRFKFVRAL